MEPIEDLKIKPLQRLPLRLRTIRHFSNLADDIAHLLWSDLLDHGQSARLEPHRFVYLAHILNGMLLRYIGDCESCVTTGYCDPWARTGGGPPTAKQRPPICPEHASRLLREAGPQLNILLYQIERAMVDFIDCHLPGAISDSSGAIVASVEAAMERTVKPYLIKNIASSCCDECERES